MEPVERIAEGHVQLLQIRWERVDEPELLRRAEVPGMAWTARGGAAPARPLDVQLARDLPAVVGDRVQLQQVVLNLILNGVEAAGAVAEGPRELVVSSETDAGKGVLVSVRDTGGGFDEAKASRLFDAFFTTKPGGLGMGLAISRSIVESHRGRIWAAPNSPRGAVFRFTVPVLATA